MVDKLDCSLIVYFRALKRKYDEYYKIMIPPNHHSKRYFFGLLSTFGKSSVFEFRIEMKIKRACKNLVI